MQVFLYKYSTRSVSLKCTWIQVSDTNKLKLIDNDNFKILKENHYLKSMLIYDKTQLKKLKIFFRMSAAVFLCVCVRGVLSFFSYTLEDEI